MTVTVITNIPKEKFFQFARLLSDFNGRFIDNPLELREKVQVHYMIEHHREFDEAWARCTTPIVEIRKDQWWRKALRRIRIKV